MRRIFWLFALGMISLMPLVSCREASEREILTNLYIATDGRNWAIDWQGVPDPIAYQNWLSDSPLGEWEGVTTDDHGLVIGLDLGGLGTRLRGEIPAELGDLINLKELDLSASSLEGVIPSEIGNLVNLQVLNLSLNSLSEEIPPELGRLENLEQMVLWSNELSGEIPPELANLANLKTLDLSFNDLTGEIPSELRRLTNLEYMILYRNRLTSSGLPPATDRASLMALYNSTDGANWEKKQNWLGSRHLATWYGISTDSQGRVVGIDLRNNQLEGTIPAELGNLARLRILSLGFNQLSGDIPSELARIPVLEEFNLVGNKLTGEIPPELAELANLMKLDLQGNQLSGRIPAELANWAT